MSYSSNQYLTTINRIASQVFDQLVTNTMAISILTTNTYSPCSRPWALQLCCDKLLLGISKNHQPRDRQFVVPAVTKISDVSWSWHKGHNWYHALYQLIDSICGAMNIAFQFLVCFWPCSKVSSSGGSGSGGLVPTVELNDPKVRKQVH